jgi:hypothetical protein
VVSGASPGCPKALGTPPERARPPTSVRGMADIVQAFLRTRKDLLAKLPSLKRSLTDGMVPRICYPRLTASVPVTSASM